MNNLTISIYFLKIKKKQIQKIIIFQEASDKKRDPRMPKKKMDFLAPKEKIS